MNVVLTIFAAIVFWIVIVFVGTSKFGQKINNSFDNNERFRTLLAWCNFIIILEYPIVDCIKNWHLGFCNNVGNVAMIIVFLFYGIIIFQHIKQNKQIF